MYDLVSSCVEQLIIQQKEIKMDLSSVSYEQLKQEIKRRELEEEKIASLTSDEEIQMGIIDAGNLNTEIHDNIDTLSDKEKQEKLLRETELKKQSIAISKIVNKLIDSDPVGEMRNETRAFEEECQKCIDRLSPKKETLFGWLFDD